LRSSSLSIAVILTAGCGPQARTVETEPDASAPEQQNPEPDAAVAQVFMDAPTGSVTCATPPASGACEKLELNFSTQQACTIGVLPGQAVDGEGFITVNSQNYRVLTLNRYGYGHLIGWCDATTVRDLLGQQAISKYLGQTATPRVASFGPSVLCEPGANPSSLYANQATYLGAQLPAQYVGNPAVLAQDWDVVIFCGMYEWTNDWSSTLQPYVQCMGKGVLAVMDYRQSGANAADFTNINSVVAPAGFAFEPASIDWASGSGGFNQCLPGVIL
jgi:hypothetical protein